LQEKVTLVTCKTWVLVVARYFWSGSDFYPGNLSHCVALPLEIVPDDMKSALKHDITPHFRFSPVPAPVKQTIDTLPIGTTDLSRYGAWTVCRLNYAEEKGFWFSEAKHDDPTEVTISYGPQLAKKYLLVGVGSGS
jgi:hypothetical protein